ncbi:MAG: hypothetical protein WCP77_16670 [Roseococcus sp.]
MRPVYPAMSAHNDTEEPWRLERLARLDGRVRELLRILTREASVDESSLGECVWAKHVMALHDDRGTLVVRISGSLAASSWLPVLGAVVGRAWNGEDEMSVAFQVEGSMSVMALTDILAPEGPA